MSKLADKMAPKTEAPKPVAATFPGPGAATVRTSFSVPKAWHRALKQYALDHELTISEVVIEAVAERIGYGQPKK